MSYKADEMFLEADQLISANNIVAARALLYKIIEEYPDYGRAHNHLGWLYENKLRYLNRAEEHYKAALRFSPEYPAIWLNFTYFLAVLERYDELTEHLQNALKVKGVSRSFVNNEFGSMAEMKGEYDKAIEHYTKAIKASLNDENIETYYNSIERAKKKKEL